MKQRVRIGVLTPRVQTWLSRPGPRRVRSIHRSVAYLESDDGFVALTTADVALTPLSLRLMPGQSLPPLDVGTDLAEWGFEWTDAVVWNARPDWAALDVGALCEDAVDASREAQAILRAEAPNVIDGATADALPTALLGLGPGLTPAGDDVLVGRLLAWQAGLLPGLAAADVTALLSAAETRTTRLSRAFLEAAAVGECGSAWQDLWPTRWPGLGSRRGAIRVILRTGQTSGAAALWGFLTAREARP